MRQWMRSLARGWRARLRWVALGGTPIAVLAAVLIGAGTAAGVAAAVGLGPFEDETAPARTVDSEPTAEPGLEATATPTEPAGGPTTVRLAPAPEPIADLPGTPDEFRAGELTDGDGGSETGLRLVIPKLGVNSPVVTMGILADGRTFEVPRNASQVAWYDFSAPPGSTTSNAIFSAHINYNGRAGPFNRLDEMAAGDRFEVRMPDGTIYVYRVLWGKTVPKPSLSWEDVGCRPGSGCSSSGTVTLITCGGSFDPQTRRYRDNVVVRAELADTIRPG